MLVLVDLHPVAQGFGRKPIEAVHEKHPDQCPEVRQLGYPRLSHFSDWGEIFVVQRPSFDCIEELRGTQFLAQVAAIEPVELRRVEHGSTKRDIVHVKTVDQVLERGLFVLLACRFDKQPKEILHRLRQIPRTLVEENARRVLAL